MRRAACAHACRPVRMATLAGGSMGKKARKSRPPRRAGAAKGPQAAAGGGSWRRSGGWGAQAREAARGHCLQLHVCAAGRGGAATGQGGGGGAVTPAVTPRPTPLPPPAVTEASLLRRPVASGAPRCGRRMVTSRSSLSPNARRRSATTSSCCSCMAGRVRGLGASGYGARSPRRAGTGGAPKVLHGCAATCQDPWRGPASAPHPVPATPASSSAPRTPTPLTPAPIYLPIRVILDEADPAGVAALLKEGRLDVTACPQPAAGSRWALSHKLCQGRGWGWVGGRACATPRGTRRRGCTDARTRVLLAAGCQ